MAIIGMRWLYRNSPSSERRGSLSGGKSSVLLAATALLPLLGATGARADDRPAFIGPAHAQALTIKPAPIVNQATPATLPQLEIDADSAGQISNLIPGGPVKTAGQSFFKVLGTNGRTCFTCHQPQADWSFTPAGAQTRFSQSNGTDPLFQPIDGANCPNVNLSSKSSFSLILSLGVNRIFLPLPEGAEFTVQTTSDPTNCENGAYGLNASPTPGLSLYRRPLPASNLLFMNIVNNSGRLKCNPSPRTLTTPVPGLTGYEVDLGTTGYTGSITAGSKNLTLTVAPERTLFVGQHVIVAGAGTVNPPNGGSPLKLLVTTVASVTDATHYVLANAATTTVTGATVNGASATNGQLGISENCDNIMWDGREPDLRSQFIDATLTHAQGLSAPSDADLNQGVLFQEGIFTAQSYDNLAQNLRALGANGGPQPLPGLYPDGQDSIAGSSQTFKTFDVFDSWTTLSGPSNKTTLQRESIARGQFVFNNVNMALRGIGGFNNAIGPGETIVASCNTCHNVKNVGGEILLHVVNTGVASGNFSTLPSSLPRFKLTCTSGSICQPTQAGQTCYSTSGGPPFAPLPNGTGPGQSPASQICTPQAPCTVITDDPGRALISGQCNDIGAFKTPALRGIVARPPFFHDGSAATLLDVVKFYNNRFFMCVPTTQGGSCTVGTSHLTSQQIQDLVNFLSAL